jgi:hypothetical protein
VALTPADFVFPRGALRPALLGVSDDDALRSVVEQYLSRSVQATVGVVPTELLPNAVEDARSAYVYWKAYEAAAVLRATQPTNVAITDDIVETYGGGALAFLKGQQAKYEAAFTALLPPASARRTGLAQGTAYRTVVEW